jgi:DNA-binding MarR family transcriptional regulator
MSEYPELLLENQLCFRIYTLHIKVMALYKPLLDELGITYLQYITLMVLWKEGEQKVSDICEKTDIDVGTISPMLKRMEKNNLITRTRDKGDERIVNISLTDKGEEMKHQATHIPAQLISCFDDNPLLSEFSSIVEIFDSLISSLKKCSPSGTNPALPR